MQRPRRLASASLTCHSGSAGEARDPVPHVGSANTRIRVHQGGCSAARMQVSPPARPAPPPQPARWRVRRAGGVGHCWEWAGVRAHGVPRHPPRTPSAPTSHPVVQPFPTIPPPLFVAITTYSHPNAQANVGVITPRPAPQPPSLPPSSRPLHRRPLSFMLRRCSRHHPRHRRPQRHRRRRRPRHHPLLPPSPPPSSPPPRRGGNVARPPGKKTTLGPMRRVGAVPGAVPLRRLCRLVARHIPTGPTPH